MSVLDAVIDVSHNNGAIDWNGVAQAGIVLTFIKASEGTDFTDPLFKNNVAKAKAAGLMVIPYHFMRGQDALGQAKQFITAAGLTNGVPAMLDWEVSSTSEDTLKAMGVAVKSMINRMPIGYYGASWVEEPDTMLSTWPLLLPAYPRGNTPGTYASLVTHPPKLPAGRAADRPYDFQQYTPVGSIKGITSPVDRSVWIGTKDELVSFFNTGIIPASTAPVLPEPVVPISGTELGMHSYGPDVSKLQNALVKAGYKLAVDADFGKQTLTELLLFQHDHKLPASGKTDSATRVALGL